MTSSSWACCTRSVSAPMSAATCRASASRRVIASRNCWMSPSVMASTPLRRVPHSPVGPSPTGLKVVTSKRLSTCRDRQSRDLRHQTVDARAFRYVATAPARLVAADLVYGRSAPGSRGHPDEGGLDMDVTELLQQD